MSSRLHIAVSESHHGSGCESNQQVHGGILADGQIEHTVIQVRGQERQEEAGNEIASSLFSAQSASAFKLHTQENGKCQCTFVNER